MPAGINTINNLRAQDVCLLMGTTLVVPQKGGILRTHAGHRWENRGGERSTVIQTQRRMQLAVREQVVGYDGADMFENERTGDENSSPKIPTKVWTQGGSKTSGGEREVSVATLSPRDSACALSACWFWFRFFFLLSSFIFSSFLFLSFSSHFLFCFFPFLPLFRPPVLFFGRIIRMYHGYVPGAI